MVGSQFRQALQHATGLAWEEWVPKLQAVLDSDGSVEEWKRHIMTRFSVAEEWAQWLAVLYGQMQGRVPVGVTRDAGVQIGVRKTVDAAKEDVWHLLVSRPGLWLGEVGELYLAKGAQFRTPDGIAGELKVVVPFQKLRMTWRRPEWGRPSRLQVTLLATRTGKTTIAVHQEMLEDVYVRELMRRHWEAILEEIKAHLEER
ncbi:MAG: SRPBCC domain-containing protein [Limnochordaceae bacterium]|nr:SRPBCC domain-containing protein [Limnochordaceae bacterium]